MQAPPALLLDLEAFNRLLTPLRNAAITKDVLLRQPHIRDRSGLKYDASVSSKRAWCSMLRDSFDSSGVDVSDAALLLVYLVCMECAKCGRAQLCSNPAPAAPQRSLRLLHFARSLTSRARGHAVDEDGDPGRRQLDDAAHALMSL
jgi:hypothetical protein